MRESQGLGRDRAAPTPLRMASLLLAGAALSRRRGKTVASQTSQGSLWSDRDAITWL